MSLTGYLLSLSAIAMLTSLTEMVLPSGRTKQAVVAVYSMLLLLVIVSPLIKLKNRDFSVLTFADNGGYNIDYEYKDYATQVAVDLAENKALTALEKAGYGGVEVTVLTEVVNGETIVKNILINLKNLVILQDGAHINKTEVIQIVANCLSVDERAVVIIENQT